ncbi:MAG: KUP/HAK/KT family potassium transporter [Halioglobus sp.]
MTSNEEPASDTPISPSRAVVVAALGVVFGDIGTSPLYALRESFSGIGSTPLDRPDLLGVMSLILWALVLVISIKYLVFILRADNQGEGGIIALVALLNPWRSNPRQSRYWLMLLGLFGACLLYGDGTITPAISVLSAVEGLQVAAPGLTQFVVPITVAILIVLFSVQRHGSGRIGGYFGPVMLVWFVVLAMLGVRGIVMEPTILAALNPLYAVNFFISNGWSAFLTLGAVFLVVTGGEALYADLGHFGISPIRRAWFYLVFPALSLNYLGQGGLLLQHPEAIQAPFFHLAPTWATLPLVVLATVATVIASQAVISATFSLTRQAIQLGQLPRMRVIYTQAEEAGQIYLPLVNWLLMVASIALVVGFGSSDALASAYGVAVSMDMVVTTILAVAVAKRFGWHPLLAFGMGMLFVIIDGAFLGANLVKIPEGGWYACVIAAVIFLLMWSWRSGERKLSEELQSRSIAQKAFLQQIEAQPPIRVPGTAVVLTGRNGPSIPAALVHHLACTQVLHERVVLLNVAIADTPHVPAAERLESTDLGLGLVRLRVLYGFSQPPNIPLALKLGEHVGLPIATGEAVYILSSETLIPRPGLRGVEFVLNRIYLWMARNEARATAYFRLPEERVLELGLQVVL